MVHTANQVYGTKYRLYELEELLPGNFIRISKSAILNAGKVRAIHKNITGASEVEFVGSGKKVFVSRNYFKVLMEKLEEKSSYMDKSNIGIYSTKNKPYDSVMKNLAERIKS